MHSTFVSYPHNKTSETTTMKKPIHKPNFYVFAGTPSSGKTSALKALSQKGFQTVPEAARKVIKAYQQSYGVSLLDTDKPAYCTLMLKQCVADFLDHAHNDNIIFFDRGLPDAAYAASAILGQVSAETAHLIETHRYHSHVFLFPPWKDIFKSDEIRPTDFNDIEESYERIKQAYLDYSYQIIEVPKIDIIARVNFILETLQE